MTCARCFCVLLSSQFSVGQLISRDYNSMATPGSRVNNKRGSANLTPPTGSKKNKPEICVTCKKEASVDAIECQWCTNWEHKVCANISSAEYKILDTVSANIMFFCSMCIGKVPVALSSYLINTNIESLEQKVMQLSSDINNQFETQLKSFEEKLSALEQKIYQAAPSETTLCKNQKLLHE